MEAPGVCRGGMGGVAQVPPGRVGAGEERASAALPASGQSTWGWRYSLLRLKQAKREIRVLLDKWLLRCWVDGRFVGRRFGLFGWQVTEI